MSAVLTAATPGSAWRRTGLALGLVLGAILVGYAGTVQAMVDIWNRSGTFAHAWGVLPIALWLVWRRREALAAATPQPQPLWLLPLAGAALLWLVGELASVHSATQLALVAMLVAAVPALIGNAAARVIAFPLAFVFFAVPIGEFLVPQMIVWTADFTVAAVRLSGVPVYREGEQLVIPTGQWSVVEACSGVRYLISSLMIGTLYAYLSYRTLSRRLAFVALSIVVPIVANWVRAYLIVMTGHLSGNRLAVGVDHLIYGWVFFGLVVMLMFWIGGRFADPPSDAAPVAAVPRLPGSAPAPWVAAAVVLALALLPRGLQAGLDASGEHAAPELARLAPVAAGGWTPAAAPATDWKPAFGGSAAERTLGFADGRGHQVGVYVGYYREQGYGRKLVSSTNGLEPDDGKVWRRFASSAPVVDVAGETIAWRGARVRGSAYADSNVAQRLTVWQVYWVDGPLTASDWRAKAWGVWNKLRGRGDDAAVLLVYTEDREDEDSAAVLDSFVRAQLPALRAGLAAVRDGR